MKKIIFFLLIALNLSAQDTHPNFDSLQLDSCIRGLRDCDLPTQI